jgi:hypothetical protein
MGLITRAVAALAAILGLAVAGAGAATADTTPAHHHHHGLIGEITLVAPITVVLVDNAIAVLGVAEHDD